MHWIDLILNLAAWILWMHGSTGLMQASKRMEGISLGLTLKAISPARINPSWFLMMGVLLILCFKILLLHTLGKPLASTMSQEFLLMPVFFKTGSLSHMACMGIVTFLRCCIIGYVWLWFIRRMAMGRGMESLQEALDGMLGPLARAHAWIQPVCLWLMGLIAWMVVSGLLVQMEILPSRSLSELLWQATFVSLAGWLTLKWLIAMLLLCYLAHSYIYLGSWEGWDWLEHLVERLLWPMKSLPLHWKRIDFAPVVAIPLYWVTFLVIERAILYLGTGVAS